MVMKCIYAPMDLIQEVIDADSSMIRSYVTMEQENWRHFDNV